MRYRSRPRRRALPIAAVLVAALLVELTPLAGAPALARWLASPSAVPPPGSGASSARPTRTPILMLHRIADRPDSGSEYGDLVLPPAQFAADLGALARAGWRSVTAADLGRAWELGIPVPACTFSMTFDDGRRDGYSAAWPIMEATGRSLTLRSGRWVERSGSVGTFYVIVGRFSDPLHMSWPQAVALALAGNEIASHTERHVDLGRASAARIATEIDEAAVRIERHLLERGIHQRVVTLAYPYGSTGPAAVAALAARGYLLAVTTVGGIPTAATNPLLAPRVRVSRSQTPERLLELLAPGSGPGGRCPAQSFPRLREPSSPLPGLGPRPGALAAF